VLCKEFKAFYFTTTTFFWRVLCREVVVAKKGSQRKSLEWWFHPVSDEWRRRIALV
jgi:hypothetical protein